MKLRLIHIIAFFLFSLFVSKEVAADVKLIHAQKKELCSDCESRSSEKGTEERTAEQEQKLLFEAVQMPLPVCSFLVEETVYNAPYIPCIDLGILTPPPELT